MLLRDKKHSAMSAWRELMMSIATETDDSDVDGDLPRRQSYFLSFAVHLLTA